MKLPTLFIAICLALSLSVCQAQKLIRSFGTCPEINNYYINTVLPLVGPSGLTSSNAKTETREPTKPYTPGAPGGPAGLLINQPYTDPKFIEAGNITVGDEFLLDDDDDDDAKQAGKDFSVTNVQVKGVDEADIIKTDGNFVYTIAGRKFSVVKVLNAGGDGIVQGSFRLPTYPDDMLLEKDFVVVIGRDDTYKRPVHRRYKNDPSTGEDSTVLYQISVRNGVPKLVSTLHLEGRYVKARETNGVARIVIKYNPLSSIWLYTPSGNFTEAKTTMWNREIIQYSRAGNWLPTYTLKKGKQRQVGVYAACGDMYYSPDVFAGFSLLFVVTLPLNKLMSPSSSASIISDADALYVTRQSMYVTTGEFSFGNVSDSAARWGAEYKTRIHRFSLSDAGAKYAASGQITGSVLNRFSMHEFRGHFFIASTIGASWWSGRSLSESKVISFKIDDSKRLLQKVGMVGNLGLGERIFAVRFRRAIAYVVTFRETDPLYIIDLTRPWDLRIRGELKIPGFSTYLHYVEPGRVLGVGKDVSDSGTIQGNKVSLFDVSNQTDPRELAVWSLKGSYSNAEWDNRAFLYWRKLRLAVMPIVVTEDGTEFSGAIVLRITDKSIIEVGRIQHFLAGSSYHPRILRNIVIGRFLWSMSSQLLQINELVNIRKRRAVVEIGDNVVKRVPSIDGVELFASYTWPAEARDLDTGTQFLEEKVGYSCASGNGGKYMTFSGDNTGEEGNEDVTVLIGKALKEKKFKGSTVVLFNAGWHGAEFKGESTLTLRLVKSSTGKAISGTELSLPINPGAQSGCSNTLVATLTVEITSDVKLTLRTV